MNQHDHAVAIWRIGLGPRHPSMNMEVFFRDCSYLEFAYFILLAIIYLCVVFYVCIFICYLMV